MDNIQKFALYVYNMHDKTTYILVTSYGEKEILKLSTINLLIMLKSKKWRTMYVFIVYV